jgi:NDP-sugar pyrophosphorylase family protein
MVCIGAGCILDDEVVIQNSVIWDRVRVRAGYSVRGCIIGDGVEVGESLKGEVVSAKGRVKLTAGS